MTAKKKPAKKQAAKPVVKLIDGQYKIKQLFRLKPDAAEVLERYAKTNHCKTLNGSLEGLLSSFNAMVITNNWQREEISKLKDELFDARDIINNFQTVINATLKFKID